MSNPPFLIVGLGNPGKEYANTRHNLGFVVIDKLINESEAKPVKTKTQAKAWGMVREGFYYSLNYLLPQTFMNLSGEAVRSILDFYKLLPEDILVIHDDVDLDFGRTKKQLGGGSAGHHGIEDITKKLGTADFWRFRVGVGRPDNARFDVLDWVLSDFSEEELTTLKKLNFLS